MSTLTHFYSLHSFPPLAAVWIQNLMLAMTLLNSTLGLNGNHIRRRLLMLIMSLDYSFLTRLDNYLPISQGNDIIKSAYGPNLFLVLLVLMNPTSDVINQLIDTYIGSSDLYYLSSIYLTLMATTKKSSSFHFSKNL